MDQGPTVGIFIRLPEREADQLRRHAAALDVTSSRLVRMIVHGTLEDARRGNVMWPGSLAAQLNVHLEKPNGSS